MRQIVLRQFINRWHFSVNSIRLHSNASNYSHIFRFSSEFFKIKVLATLCTHSYSFLIHSSVDERVLFIYHNNIFPLYNNIFCACHDNKKYIWFVWSSYFVLVLNIVGAAHWIVCYGFLRRRRSPIDYRSTMNFHIARREGINDEWVAVMRDDIIIGIQRAIPIWNN